MVIDNEEKRVVRLNRKLVVVQNLNTDLADKLYHALPNWDIVIGKEQGLWENHLQTAEILIGWQKDFYERLVGTNHLKWLQSWSAGVDSYPLHFFKEKDVLLTTANGVHKNPISETVFALMLSLTRNIHTYVRNQQNKRWFHEFNQLELHGKTIGIIGVGAIGQEIAKISKAFNMKVIGVRHSGKSAPFIDNMYHHHQLDEVLPQCDYVVCATPLTSETKHSFNRERFKQMKKSSFFINIGRGPVVKEDDLIWALESGEIRGAGLDVFEVEPLPTSSPLWEMEKVIITPHTSGSTAYYNERVIEDIFLPNLEAYLKDDKQLPINAVDFEKGY
ncbi:D-2-hydroxyacid dehydrogenase [Alkalihalobacillus pseudalcaliphilus]|uniref:D-2-hydroxyacid dehydrogenase n=1 Tax=Alkalihalobacillus pseudalcaliphilus TaxID=79884 RepID=UPI00064D79F7|nr:D-2-hydroxyacid dehydrogenase [Alkalihalobacillus pseudalcaliphilus]KMK75061.1 2-hydroxyacid dehydrogenase [Alkalihalobacillus pseudalcaliphilus]